jgi:hypothetical protein
MNVSKVSNGYVLKFTAEGTYKTKEGAWSNDIADAEFHDGEFTPSMLATQWQGVDVIKAHRIGTVTREGHLMKVSRDEWVPEQE